MTIESLVSHLPANRIEYHRNALAMIPAENDADPGVALLIMESEKGRLTIQCNCTASAGKKKCSHAAALAAVVRQLPDLEKSGPLDDIFRQGPWYRMAVALHNACPMEAGSLNLEGAGGTSSENGGISIWDSDGRLLVDYRLKKADAEEHETSLLLERTGLSPSNGSPVHRGRILSMLSALTLTGSERVMQERKMKSRRMALEESFWYRLSYHFRNVSAGGAVLKMAIDEKSGRFMISCLDEAREINIAIPASAAMQVRKSLEKDFHHGSVLPIWPESLESIAKVEADAHNNLKLSLYLLLHLPDGSTDIFERRRMVKYWYGETLYIPEKKVLATWKKPDRLGKLFGGKYSKKIGKDRLPEVIEKIGDIFAPPNIVDESVRRLKIHQECTRVEIDPSAVDRDWCWLSLRYGFGENAAVSLVDIYAAKMSGKRYLPVDDGWVDIRSLNMDALTGIPGNCVSGQLAEGKDTLRLSRMDILRMQAAIETPLVVDAAAGDAESRHVRSILEMRPPGAIGDLSGMTSTLRRYQHRGFEWLVFLHENRFGGLLCDEMGLGKTHQVMALMVWLAENRRKAHPCIVVCPTTVISHWERKIRDHAPALKPVVYYGADREIEDMSVRGRVLITSYGILLRDIGLLSQFRFSVAAFDEAQFIKNAATKSYGAAASVKAELKLAVTGTPVENRLGDLKTLMDLVLPGYLGSGEAFRMRYETGDRRRRSELRRLVSPFALRRTKSAVLDELPEKIEDIRYCRLADAQVKLYREAVSGRGSGLLSQLEKGDGDIPYIHIFALLTLLKQICNHPASISPEKAGGRKRKIDPALMEPGNSGKWDLFVELVDACLENNEKIVVFSQFVSMVNIILVHLKNKGVQTASITGETRNRGDEIDRFNTDSNCRVFVGSLKAGGSGIDLTGGSVVIHYDRWWNAAREDQATDRVHRIGQTRGVQVFKLVTEGTLEEKIAAIIDRKKHLMGEVISEDDPGTLKTFNRDELIDLMAMPAVK